MRHHQAGRLEQAEQIYREILQANPQHPDAMHLLGVIAHQAGNHEAAVDLIRRAVVLKPDVADYHNNLAAACQALGRLDEAVAGYELAVRLRPDYVEALTNLGRALQEQEKFEEAVAARQKALQINPNYLEAHKSLGSFYQDQGQFDRALSYYKRALEIKPDYAEAHFYRSLVWLLQADFRRGWPEYEWRWQARHFTRRDFSQSLWDGRALNGQTILLHAEQGLGDTLQFVRYAPLVKERDGTVIVECQRPLVELLGGIAGVDRLVGAGDELPPFDVHAPLMSLPGIFETSVENIPAEVPYLFANPALIQRWRHVLDDLDGFKIGIGWQGRPSHSKDRYRSIPLVHFAPLARVPGVCLVSLQKGPGVGQLAGLTDQSPVTDLGSQLDEAAGPFMDTAAVMMNLDLVVTSDTATAHLAGALGVPVWVTLPFVPDWRWLLDRNDSPWYPTMRLFRQSRIGDWKSVFERVEAALRRHLVSPKSGTTHKMDR